ncbi:DUF4350 domain-containing protein [Janthinobacterium sp. 17J80-10]|uniref:DUF4350 domain-containing protein n=1 Tax=Janthinobacterium sp. 17J80-10 TaxID=2497863 RepID=UPI00100580D3|nr:DUF4350 domain-containing protein [Janthinobacterium sp. 17J80-10]QAU32727.1 DUF4350 domain-containing protein [Janthinobacterium sp. 17J80-10]
MSYSQRQWLMAALGVLLVALGTWWWFANYEKRWVARHHQSEAVRTNPMLAATRLLSGRGYAVTTAVTLREALQKNLPKGTLLIAENDGVVSAEQAERLLAWVRQGNTLIMRPKWGSDATDNEEGKDAEGSEDDAASDVRNGAQARRNKATAPIETDPIGAHFGVALKQGDCACKNRRIGADASADAPKPAAPSASPKASADKLSSFTLPGAAYSLQLDASYARMTSFKSGPPPLHGDAAGDTVRVYGEGRGYVVLLARNYFNNHQLIRYDHAEMLLGLAGLVQHPGQHFLIVRGLDMAKWYQALWTNFYPGLIGIACILLLLLWAALRRFGPPLPEPLLERRSLIEHIDASGRWLWSAAKGREILLGAARAAANKAWQRRMPELLRLHPDQQIERLAQAGDLDASDLVSALRHPAGKAPAIFTRQIHILRQLRQFHER